MTKLKTAVFVDGENLVFRFQDMLKAGAEVRPGLPYRRDEFIWCPELFYTALFSISRVSYYTSVVGDDAHLGAVVDVIQNQIVSNPMHGREERVAMRLHGKVFKKPAKSQKSRLVDIHITLDSLRATYRHDIDQILFITGDGDFLPVIEEIMRTGKRVMVSALSSGLAPAMKRVPDEFYCIDSEFFSKLPAPN